MLYRGQVKVGGDVAREPRGVPERVGHREYTCSQPDREGPESAEVRACSSGTFCHQGGREIDRLEDIGVLEKVEFSRWATPIVPVPKADGTFRLCGDYKATLNAALEVDQHPLPKPEEIFVSLAGGQRLTTLDLSQAYQQLVLDDASKELVTINTHQGLYRCTRLPFGVASAPAIFQRTMDQVLHGLPGVMCYLDDIIITGATVQKHLSNLAAVLAHLRERGFWLKKDKCHFMQTTVEYIPGTCDRSQGATHLTQEMPGHHRSTSAQEYYGTAILFRPS